MNIDQKVASFMEDFLETPISNIDEEYFAIEERYNKMFGHPVPSAMLPDGISIEFIKDAMKECIDSKEDKLFSLLNIKILDEALY